MRCSIGPLLALSLGACAQTVVRPCDATVRAGDVITVSDVRDLDLLFVVDSSSSMAEEQGWLAAELPRLVSVLATGDVDGDGAAELEPIRSLHVGVVTTDLGSGGHALPTCERPELGDDARFERPGATLADGCAAGRPAFLAFAPGGDPVAFADALRCATTVGTAGCAFEQPLEAALKALSPAAPTRWTAADYVAPRFFGDTAGHGDGAHDGFLRAGAALAIVPFTDEDDCSFADPDLLDPDSATYAATSLNLRCAEHPDALNPIERFVDGLLALRSHPGLLLFAPVVGVPLDLEPALGGVPDYDRLVGPADVRDPRMRVEVDAAAGDRLVASCDGSGGVAFPPERIVQVAEALAVRGARSTVRSICRGALGSLPAEIAAAIRPGGTVDCVTRPLTRASDGSVACAVEVLPEVEPCDAIAGAAPALDAAGAPRVEDGRAVCSLAQRVPSPANRDAGVAPTGEGWWYDDYLGPFECAGDPPSRLALPELPFGARVVLRCEPETLGARGLGEPCDPGAPDACADGLGPYGERRLACDAVSATCSVVCEADRDCARAHLVDAVCASGVCAPLACVP
ncbi:MAG: hypothetical protein H6719_04820 [Sandaracinaceae bacterium]|nr:hypothetical protein [Sandaracinaceae bacterium]